MPQFIQAPAAALLNPQGSQPTMRGGSRGFIIHNDFSAASQTPQIDRRAFVQAAASGAAIGEGLQNVGQQIDKISQIRNHAYSQRRLAEVDAAWQLKQADLAKALADEKDTNKWEAIAQQHVADFQKSVVTDDLLPDARDAIQNKALYLGSHAVGQAKIAAANREVQVYGQQLNANFINAIDAGDWETAKRQVSQGVKDGVFAEDVAASKLVEVSNREKKSASENAFAALNDPTRRDVEGAKAIIEAAPFTSSEKAAELARIDATHGVNQQRDEFQKIVLKDPAKAKLMLENGYFAKILPGDRTALALDAERTQAAYATDAFKDVKERIDLGQVKAGEKFDSPAFSQLTPHMKLELQTYLAKKEQHDALNDPSAYQQAFTAVSGYNPAQDESGLKKAQLEATLQTRFAGSYLDTLKSKLDERAKGVKPDSVPLSDAFSVLDDWAFKDKRFGDYEAQKTDNAGRGIFTKQKVNTLQPDGTIQEVEQLVTEKEIDPVKRDAVTSKVQGIKQKLEAEVKAGKITDRLMLMQRLSALTGMSVTSEAASQALPKTTLFPSGAPAAAPDLNSILKKYAPNPGK